MKNYTLENSLGYLTQVVSKGIGDRLLYHFHHSALDTSRDEWLVMTYLMAYQPKNQQQLSEILQRNKTSTKRVIDKMEERNLIKRYTDVNDKRNNLLVLTAHGREKYEMLSTQAALTLEEVAVHIDSQELEQCKLTLKKIIKVLKKIEAAQGKY